MSASAKTMRFDRGLYAGTAVDAAIQRLAGHAEFDRGQRDDAWEVTVRVRGSAARLRAVCGTLANLALGLTVRAGGADEGRA